MESKHAIYEALASHLIYDIEQQEPKGEERVNGLH